MAGLTKEQILAADDVEIESCEAWGGTVYLRGMMGWERDQLDAESMETQSLVHYRAKVVSRCLCDENGKPLDFTEEDMLALSRKGAKTLNRVFEMARKLSGIGKDDVEELEKNLKGRSASSGASSPIDGEAPSKNSSTE